jgi:hypothetical protein
MGAQHPVLVGQDAGFAFDGEIHNAPNFASFAVKRRNREFIGGIFNRKEHSAAEPQPNFDESNHGFHGWDHRIKPPQ